MSLGNRGLYGSILLLIPLLLLLTSGAALANSAVEPVKVGDITHFTGTVLVRSTGRWSRLSEVPVALYKTDKVVTKDGRAEITLVDTGTVRMDRDSNITITQRMEGTGMRCECVGRQVNVLVGSVLFDIDLHRDGPEEFKVRTPDMVAAIRGTTFPVVVNADGTTRYDLSGDAAVRGGERSDLLSQPQLRNEDITIPHARLPRGDRAVAALPIMQAVDRVFAKNQQTDEQFKRFEAMVDAAEHQATTSNDPVAIVGQARISKARADSYLRKTEGYVLDAESSVAEVERMTRQVVGSITYYRSGSPSYRDQLLASMGLLLEWLLPPAAHAAAESVLSAEMDLQAAQTALAAARQALELATAHAAKAAEAAEAAEACLTSREGCSDEELRILAAAADAQAGAVEAAAYAAAAQAIVAMNSYVGTDENKRDAAREAANSALEHARIASGAAIRASAAAAAAEDARGDALQLAYLQTVANLAAAEANANAAIAEAIVATLLTQDVCNVTFAMTNAKRIGTVAEQADEAAQRASAATTPETARGHATSAQRHWEQTERWLQGFLGGEHRPDLSRIFQEPERATQQQPIGGGGSTPEDASPIGRME